MTVYVVARLRFVDEARYRRYQMAFSDVFAGSGGTLLAADEAPQRLDESAADDAETVDKVVLMSFPDEEAARALLTSEGYTHISVDRNAGAETVSYLVQGLDPPLR